MKVLACDLRDVKPEAGVAMVDFDTLLAQADVLSIHIHLTEENRGLINATAFAKMKPGAVLINTSRGAILDETALLEALTSGRLAGAALDVICGEWDANLAEHPLIRHAREHENLVISPHIGGVTVESQQLAMERTAGKLLAFLEAQHAAQ
jgi:D-3-phosphoglycerate dehydrogenase